MPRHPGRRQARWLLPVGGLLVASVVAGAPGPAAAAPISRCTTTTGVIVAVDFRHFGGAITRGCSPTPTTGYDALHNAGYTTAGDDEDGPAFICRINDDPSPAQASCTRTPSASSAWSYWYANPGHNSWSFHELGAMSTHPVPGSVDAWVFGSTVGGGSSGEPTFSPASVRATTTSPTPSPTPSPTRTRPAIGHSHHGHHHVSTAPKRGTTPPTASAPATATATPTPTPHSSHRANGRRDRKGPDRAEATQPPSPSPSPTGPRIVDEAGTDPTSPASNGSPIGLLIAAALVVGLGTAGGVTAWRRRRPH